MDDLLQFRRQRIKLAHQVRQQFVLNRFPALHDLDRSDRIHLSGQSDDDLDNLIMPEMAARSSFFAARAKEFCMERAF
jgi:hypothetical protein